MELTTDLFYVLFVWDDQNSEQKEQELERANLYC